MYTTKFGHKFQLATLTYFILSSLLIGVFVSNFNLELNIISGIIVSQFFMVGLVVFVYLYITKQPIRTTLLINKISLIDGLISVGIAWTIMPLLSVINVASQFFVKNAVTDALSETLNYPFIITLLLTAVTPAILEEFLTRSLIIHHYKKHSVLVVCLLSGAFFGFIHLNINQFLYAFLMGVVMCYIVMITKSIISSSIIHFTINASGIVMLYASNALLEAFDSSGVLIEELINTTAPTTTELLMSLIGVFILALFTTPVCVILIGILLKRHGKTFEGSLKLPGDVFMNAMPKVDSDHKFSEDMAEAISHKKEVPPLSNEKVMTPIYMVTIMIFMVFVILLEIMPS